jgi:hypothetical protein
VVAGFFYGEIVDAANWYAGLGLTSVGALPLMIAAFAVIFAAVVWSRIDLLPANVVLNGIALMIFVVPVWQIASRVAKKKMAQWALVVALVGFFVICVFSLFFLLVKERTVSGAMQVTVRSGDRAHTAMVPVHSLAQRNQIHQQFNYCRSLASAA